MGYNPNNPFNVNLLSFEISNFFFSPDLHDNLFDNIIKDTNKKMSHKTGSQFAVDASLIWFVNWKKYGFYRAPTEWRS